MRNLIDLTGKKIIVAGASSGIGKRTAITLSELGAEVVLTARREDKLQEIAQNLVGRGKYYVGDLSDIESIEALIKKIVCEVGLLDGMVYAAGMSKNIPLGQLSYKKSKEVMDINYFGFLEMTRQITKRNRFNPGMRIVAISSVSSLKGNKAQTPYSASKAAINATVRCLAYELADRGICVNAVAPGMTETEMYSKYLANYGKDGEANRTLLQRQYLGIANTNDIANAIAFLISPAAHFITGVTLPVDGGYTSA